MTPSIITWEECISTFGKHKARGLGRAKIGQYTMESGVLFKKGYLIPMLRCVGPLQANYVIREIFMGSCGMHVGPRAVVRKAMRQGYYWPTMHADAKTRYGLPRSLLWGNNGAQMVSDHSKVCVQGFENSNQMEYCGSSSSGHRVSRNGITDGLYRGNQDQVRKGKGRMGRQIAKCVVGPSHFNQAKQWRDSLQPDLRERSGTKEVDIIREARYKTKMEQYYNKKVRPAGFRPGEFVYRRNEASRVEDQGKLGPKWEGPYSGHRSV
ncbi:hypothetical protein Tco_0740505 [Tanacetum coccineum]